MHTPPATRPPAIGPMRNDMVRDGAAIQYRDGHAPQD